MSETKRRRAPKTSPTPWNADTEGTFCGPRLSVTDAQGSWVAEFEHFDARARAIACVNACAGIPTEALESGALRDLLTATAAYFAPCPADLPEDRFVEYLDRHYDDACSALRRLGRLP